MIMNGKVINMKRSGGRETFLSPGIHCYLSDLFSYQCAYNLLKISLSYIHTSNLKWNYWLWKVSTREPQTEMFHVFIGQLKRRHNPCKILPYCFASVPQLRYGLITFWQWTCIICPSSIPVHGAKIANKGASCSSDFYNGYKANSCFSPVSNLLHVNFEVTMIFHLCWISTAEREGLKSSISDYPSSEPSQPLICIFQVWGWEAVAAVTESAPRATHCPETWVMSGSQAKYSHLWSIYCWWYCLESALRLVCILLDCEGVGEGGFVFLNPNFNTLLVSTHL